MTAAPPPDDTLNDIGNAERFATAYWGTLAFVPEAGIWRRWDRTRWKDDDDEAVRAAAVVARSWFDDLACAAAGVINAQFRDLRAANASADPDGAQKRLGHASAQMTRTYLRGRQVNEVAPIRRKAK